jgi:phospholipid/cholesterol/gamma-HCH transport system ATP-binding protein
MDRNWPDKINENPDSADEASTADAISNAAQAWSFLSFEDGGSGEDLLPPSSLNSTNQNLTEINTDNKIILPSSPEPQINSIHENLSSGNPSQNKQEIQTSAPPENARIEFQTNRSNETEKEVIIEFDNVTKVFRNQVVLRNLSFKIHKGETVCLIGESGCGKTVNLKLMIGLMKADKGIVRFHGRDLARMNEKQITATRIKFGFLFQMAALFDSMTIYDNVAFGLREHRLMPESAMPGYIKERLLEVGLPPGVELKKPAELSGGQRKRVGLARALALRPEVMLYDEPTTGLDPIMTDIINELIIQTQGHDDRAGIIVTHEMRTVTKCADRVIMLYPLSRLEPDEDQILYDGPPEGLEHHHDPRVRQFVLGEAGDRLREMSVARLADDLEHGVVPADPDEFVSGRKQ